VQARSGLAAWQQLVVAAYIEKHIAESKGIRDGLNKLGIDLEDVARELEQEAVKKFVEPFDKLQGWLEERRGQ